MGKEDHLESDEESENQSLLPQGQKDPEAVGSSSSQPEQERGFLASLQHDFGGELLFLIFCVEHLMVGFDRTLVTKTTPYLYLAYNVQAPIAQMYNSYMRLAYCARPVLGLVSDVFPIRGYRLAPYMMFWTVLGVAGLVYLSLPALGMEYPSSVIPAVCALILFWLQLSACQLLEVIRYGEAINQKPHRGPNLVSYVSLGVHVGELVAVLCAGPLLLYVGYSSVFLVALVPSVAVAYPVLKGYLMERQVSTEEVQEVRAKYWEQIEITALGPLLFAGAVLIMITGFMWDSPLVTFSVAVAVGVAVVLSFWLLLSPVIARFNIFLLISLAGRPDFGGAAFYFYTDTPDMYPEGPHFSIEFFNSGLGAVSAVCGVLGAITYYQFLRKWEYKNIVLLTTALFTVLSFLDVFMITRANLKWGIPDHFLIVGLSGADHILEQWVILPAVLMLSALCPKGTEGMIYALMLGCVHLGQSISNTAGAFLLDVFDVRPRGMDGETSSFDNLWVVAMISAIAPILFIGFVYRLIPDVVIAPEAGDRRPNLVPASASEGSPLKRWRAGA